MRTNDVLDYKMSGNTIILEKVSSIPELTVEDLFRDYEGEPVN
ncbi:transcriptional regulator [Streptococcus mutans]|nr:transcriptional regulator [Streptococcus mutans]